MIDVSREILVWNSRIYEAKLNAKRADQNVSDLENEFALWNLKMYDLAQEQSKRVTV